MIVWKDETEISEMLFDLRGKGRKKKGEKKDGKERGQKKNT